MSERRDWQESIWACKIHLGPDVFGQRHSFYFLYAAPQWYWNKTIKMWSKCTFWFHLRGFPKYDISHLGIAAILYRICLLCLHFKSLNPTAAKFLFNTWNQLQTFYLFHFCLKVAREGTTPGQWATSQSLGSFLKVLIKILGVLWYFFHRALCLKWA